MSDGSVVIEISLDDKKADKQLDAFEQDLAKAGTNAGAALDKAYREAVSDIASQSKRLKDTFVNAFKSMGSAGSNALKASLNFMRELPSNVQAALSKLASTVKTGFVNAAKASITAIKELGTSIKNTAVNIKNGFFSIAKTVQSSIVSAVKVSINVIKSIPGAIKSAGISIKSALVSSLQAAKSAAISFAQTTVKVIKSIPGAAKTAATAVKNSFVVAYKAVVVAAYMSVKGTISAVKAIPSATKSAALAVSSAMKTAFSAVSSAAKTTGTTVKSALKTGFSAVKSGAKAAGQAGISALKGLGNIAKSTGSLIKSGLVSGFNAAKAAAKGAGAGMREALKNSVEKPAEQARFSILRLAAAFGLIAATKNVVGSAIGRVDTIDTATKSLTVLTGSAKDAQLVMKDLTAAIDGTPIALDAVALGAKKMVAAGMKAADVKPVFTAIADAAYGVGNGSESIDQMTDAISALQASGVAYADDINRLVDAGVPAWQILANSTGKSVGEMKKYVSEGSLESTKAIAMLTKGIEEGTTGMAGNTAKMAGLAKTAGNTISGSFANMKTAAVKSLANIAENLKGPIIQALDVAKNAFKQFAAVTASPEFQKKLSDLIQKIKEFIPVLIEWAPLLAKVAAGFVAFNILSSVYSKVAGLVMAFRGLASSGTLLGGIVNTVKGSFLALKVALGSAAAAFGVIIAVIGAVIAVAYGMYVSFKENTANIKGFLSTMWDGVKNSFGKIVDVFKQIVAALKPVGSGFKDVLKYVGVAIWASLGLVLAAVVDIIQVLARIVLVAIKALQGLYYAIKAAFQALHWDLKGAKKSLEQSKDAFVEAGSAIKDAFNKDNYALTGTVEAFKQMGGEAENTAKKTETSGKKIKDTLKLVETTAKQTETTVSKSNQAIDTMLSGGVDQYGKKLSEKTESFLNAAKDLYEQYQEATKKSQDKYSVAMEKAQSLEGDKRKKAIADANATLVAEIDKNNGTLLTLQADYAKLLKGNKWVDGTELTAQQKKFLQQQTADIQAELAKQNQLYVEGNLLKLSNGKTLNEKERSTSIEVQKSLYADRKKAVETGEKELADLKKKKSDATTETEKANYQIQIDEQTKKNKTLAENLQKWASEMNAIIANGGTLNAETFAKGLSEMGNISDEQLSAVWQDFVKVSGSIDNTLAGLGAIMSQRGGEGVQAFVTALQSGDYTTAALNINNDVMNTLSTLPNGMFQNGQSGKDQFITAIKSGDFQGAGKFLLDGVKLGASPLPGEMNNIGKQGGNANADGLKSTAEANKRAGAELKNNAKNGAFDPNLFKMTGANNASGFNGGILDGKGNAFSAGTGIGNSAKSGAASVDSSGVGSDFASGYVDGILSGMKKVGEAAGSLANKALQAVKDAQKSKSPSKKAKKLGRDFGSGYSLGIADKNKAVTKAANNLVAGALGTEKQIKKLSTTLKDKISSAIDAGLHSKNKSAGQLKQAKALNSIEGYIGQQTNKLAATAKKRDKVVAQLKAANTKMADLTKQSKEYAASITEKMQSYGSISNVDPENPQSIQQEMQKRLKEIKAFQANVEKLRKKGVSKDIVSDILDAGVENGSSYAQALAKSDAKTIKAINSTQNQINSASKSMGNTAANAMYSAGINAAKGLINGLNSQKKQLENTAKSIANTITNSVKKALRIHSPSRVAIELGKFFTGGLGNGVLAGAKGAVQSTNKMVDKVVNAASNMTVPAITLPKISAEKALGLKSVDLNRTITVKTIIDNKTKESSNADLIKAIQKSGDRPIIFNVDGKNLAENANNRIGTMGNLGLYGGGLL
ncbi:tape measure protein [Listeria monocytogenes]|uniref:tape measure protein n=1 Tax=Listeria monocytogenes TaxID=1639 RepID=UPI0003591B60|nr:tape measure protein [Listeria monocytogenes]AGR12551.1 tape measure protein [Listeria monocytogenes]AHF27933.1 phage tail tape measure protein [Listeria monocytogenes serotype 4b str. 81-0861]ASH31129.1 phage tail tape measure protein [Listeria monocytogenes serotype 4b str. 10-0809]ASH77389.1 phage tail tape measure protein [Listeria monocytogenes serotype 4b str. 81-0558]ASH80306.1 phage tail tape measure protein [Listeria monocytogenes serotype 4b str. 81-0592]